MGLPYFLFPLEETEGKLIRVEYSFPSSCLVVNGLIEGYLYGPLLTSQFELLVIFFLFYELLSVYLPSERHYKHLPSLQFFSFILNYTKSMMQLTSYF